MMNSSSKNKKKFMLIGVLVMLLLVIPSITFAGHQDDPSTNNLHAVGHIFEPASLLNPDVGNTNIHTDIAFWGKHAFQGSWLGFNIRNISEPDNPTHVSFTSCQGNQGDIVVWGNVLVRSWNSPAAGTENCDGQAVPAGFEGVHVFDISNLADPVLVAAVETECGSHTATGVPDYANNRLLIYNSPSSGACPGIDILEVPLGNPAAASYLRFEDAGRGCHDTSVILGDAMLAACAGGDGFTMWTLADSGSLTDPDMLYSITVPGVGIGHVTAFSWDGEVLVFGHEPGGGVAPRCLETSAVSDKSMFFFDAATGAQLGTWVLPHDQSTAENCTIHNFNVVPLRSGRDVVVSGNYQAGTWVTEFTDPANPVTIAWSDPPPAPIPPPPFDFLGLDIVGAWSSYWYNNFIYETNIGEGLNVFRLSDNTAAGAMHLDHLNPQTQEFTID